MILWSWDASWGQGCDVERKAWRAAQVNKSALIGVQVGTWTRCLNYHIISRGCFSEGLAEPQLFFTNPQIPLGTSLLPDHPCQVLCPVTAKTLVQMPATFALWPVKSLCALPLTPGLKARGGWVSVWNKDKPGQGTHTLGLFSVHQSSFYFLLLWQNSIPLVPTLLGHL